MTRGLQARENKASRAVCASARNLGQALAYSGRHWGPEVTVVAASTANPLKQRQIAAFGAEVQLEGEDIEDARRLAREIAQAEGAYLVEDSWTWLPSRAPPPLRSNSSATIRSSISGSWRSAPEQWPAASATRCARSPSTRR